MHYRVFIDVRKFSARGKLHWTDLSMPIHSTDWMRIRTGPDFQIQYILYGKQQNPDCAVRIAVKGFNTSVLTPTLVPLTCVACVLFSARVNSSDINKIVMPNTILGNCDWLLFVRPSLIDAECQDIDCGANGRCLQNNDGSNQCLCDDPRWESLSAADDCSVETCSSGATCQNGGSCVKYV